MIFEKDYFKNSSISNYKDYMAKKHDLLSEDLINHLKLDKKDIIIDFGAATGNFILELLKRGYTNVFGTDVSYFAVEYGKNVLGLGDRLQYFNLELLSKEKDYVFFLDVLEHVPTEEELSKILELCKRNLRKGVVVRIPVSAKEGENFFLEVSRNDKTHVQCHCKEWWIKFFEKHGLRLKEELSLNSIYSGPGVLAAVFEPF